MERTTINGLQLWQFGILSDAPGVRHFVSDRSSDDAEQPFTLSFSSSPDKEFIRGNRQKLARAMDVVENRLVFPSQVHNARVVNVHADTDKDELMETDALITNQRGICVAVLTADCVPVLLYDKKNKAVGAVHAGWRGTVVKIVEETLTRMHDLFGTRGEDVIAGIGPSVCQESYEVGEEVMERVNNAFGPGNGLMIPQANNKAKLDLWLANKKQLLKYGVKEGNIEVSNLCTVINNEFFFSARKGDKGRFAAGIMLL